MASRTDLLDRLVTALMRPGVDGLLATADIAEDLLLLGVLEEKLVFASMNRGGLQGSVFEMDDRNTGYDVRGTIDAGFEGAKMLLRIDLEDPGTVATLERCGQAVTELNRAELIAMVEPFMSSRFGGKIVNDLSPDAVIKSVHIAQGLGASSAYTWMKLPVVHEMERVMDSTTLPTLLLGGDPDSAPDETYAAWQAALASAVLRTRALFNSGRPICDAFHGRMRYELRATWLGGTRILDRVVAARFDVVNRRPVLGVRDAPWFAWKLLSWAEGDI